MMITRTGIQGKTDVCKRIKAISILLALVVFVSVWNSVRIISANASDDVKQDADEDTQIVVTEYSDLWSGDITVKAGTLVKWYVNVPEGTTLLGCAATIKIPGLGWGTDTHNKEEGHLKLVEGNNFIYEFTVEEERDILFTCWMGSGCHHNYIHVVKEDGKTDESETGKAEESKTDDNESKEETENSKPGDGESKEDAEESKTDDSESVEKTEDSNTEESESSDKTSDTESDGKKDAGIDADNTKENAVISSNDINNTGSTLGSNTNNSGIISNKNAESKQAPQTGDSGNALILAMLIGSFVTVIVARGHKYN